MDFMTYSRFGLLFVLPAALAAQACAPAARAPANDPPSAQGEQITKASGAQAQHAADACPAIEPLLHRDVTLMLEAGERMAAGSKSLAATMSGIYTLEQTFKRSSVEVSGFKFTDPENGKDATLAAREIEASRAMFEQLRTKFEDLVRKTGTPLRQAREKAWEMRTVCEGSTKKPSAECKSIMKVFSDAELSTWMGSVDAFRDAIVKIDKMRVKDPSVANELATVRNKLTAASEAATEMLAGFDTSDVKDEVKKHTKLGYEGLSRISKRCGENTKLAPVDWVAAPSGTDPRKLTVLVVGVLPEPMRKIFDERGETKGDLTSGSTGSGVLVVRKIGSEKKVFVVTNRHVVDHALRTKVVVDGSSKYIDANVAYVDAHHDLAILEVLPGADGTIPVDAGVTLETAPAADQQTVIAAGFPGMGDRPSYQVTRGYISNRKLVLGDGEITPYIQHTAPTDSGSSGGPLLSEGGRLLGINTLKMRGREGVSISIPARLVVEAFRSIGNEQAASTKEEARVACLKTLADLGAARPPASAFRRLSAAFVADVGPPAYQRTLKRLSKDEAATQTLYYNRDPLGTLNWISLSRLQESIAASGGVSDLELCEGVTMTANTNAAPTNARFLIQTLRGPRELKLIRERGDWAVASFDFRDNGPLPTPGKGKAIAVNKAIGSGPVPVADAPKRAKEAKERRALQAK